MKSGQLYMLIFSFFAVSCKNWLEVERNESLLLNKPQHLKIVCIDPRFYFDDKEENYKLARLDHLTKQLQRDIKKFAGKNGIEMELYDLNEKSTPVYYTHLLRLKQNMLAVNFNQSTPLNFNTYHKVNSVQKKVFIYPPKIAHDFNSLSLKFGTPYFSYLGIYSVKERIILYHIVVDTDRGETVYREYKSVETKVNDSKIAQMIYDSYALLKIEFKNK